MLSYYIAVTGCWAYMERFGDGAGLTSGMIGNSLATSSVMGILGAGLATTLTARYGRLLPVFTGHLLTIAGIGILTTSITYPTYIIAACIFNFAWNFVLPYMLACIASVDTTGRLVASTNGFVGIGLALGPAMVASVYSPGNFDLALWLCCEFVGLSLVFIFRLSLSRGIST